MVFQPTRAGVSSMLAGLTLTLIGCMPAADPVDVDLAEPEPMHPVFRSNKIVTSDCGVVRTPNNVPGMAPVAGDEVGELPPPMANFLAVGSEREPVETDHERVSDGYVLIEPWTEKESFLINNQKEVVATFSSDFFVAYTQILEDGNRLSAGFNWTDIFQGDGETGCFELRSPNGELIWRVNLNSDTYISHHDVLLLDNGNFLTPVWERVSNDQVIDQGRDPEMVDEDGFFWFDGIVEVNPYTLEIVWEWSTSQHLIQDFDLAKRNYGVVADHPELLDINKLQLDPQTGKASGDWVHINAIDYDADTDQILLSSPHLSEIWIIDHSTSPWESMDHEGGTYGKGGDILYRWGNPANYNRGGAEDQTLFAQHDAQWIQDGLNGAGNILIFNNGLGKSRPYSTVTEFTPEQNADGSYILNDGMAFGPTDLAWEYNPEPPEKVFSFFISGAQRLSNGNTLVNHGAGAKIREVTPDGEIVWDYFYEGVHDAPYMIFRANKYPMDHPAIIALLGQENE